MIFARVNLILLCGGQIFLKSGEGKWSQVHCCSLLVYQLLGFSVAGSQNREVSLWYISIPRCKVFSLHALSWGWPAIELVNALTRWGRTEQALQQSWDTRKSQAFLEGPGILWQCKPMWSLVEVEKYNQTRHTWRNYGVMLLPAPR